MTTKPAPTISPDEYLEFERNSETKHEYFDGQVFPMSGASEHHNLIVVNLIVELGQQVKGGPCRVYGSDMRLRVSATRNYTYPDITVVCGAPQLEDNHLDTLLNPDVLIEVLSRSTERYDRGRKAVHYRGIPTLREYLFVRQDQPGIERYQRNSEDDWLLTEATDLDESIELAAIGCTLPLHAVYDRVF